MSLKQVSLRLDSDLLMHLDDIAKEEFKRRSDVIRDALVDFVKEQLEIQEIKEMASFEEFARIVGFNTASRINTGHKVLKESIMGAREDSKE